jgi:hypothetical protein
MSELTCERLTNKEYPRDYDGPRCFPHKCGRPAARIKARGISFETSAVLCALHRQQAEEEGLKITILEEVNADKA